MKTSDPNVRPKVEGRGRPRDDRRATREPVLRARRLPSVPPAGSAPSRVAIDPRIRRRQIDVVRAAGRRRLRLVVAGLVTMAILVAAWGVTRTPLLDVDRVVIQGATHTGAPAVGAAADIARGGAMTDVDSAGVARQVSRLPWVLRTDVVREWPSTVRIRVVERTATAVTRQDGAAWVLVDRTGRVLAPAVVPPPDLVVVDGFPAAGAPGTSVAPPARDLLEVAARLPPALAPRVATVTLGANGVELRLKPQGVVLLGDATGVADKLRAALTVLAAVDGRTVSTLDVRIPSTPVLTRL